MAGVVGFGLVSAASSLCLCYPYLIIFSYLQYVVLLPAKSVFNQVGCDMYQYTREIPSQLPRTLKCLEEEEFLEAFPGLLGVHRFTRAWNRH